MVETFLAIASCTLQHSPVEATMAEQKHASGIEMITNAEAVTIEATCTCQHQHLTAAVSGSAGREGKSASSLLGVENRAMATDIVTSPSGTTSTVSVPTQGAVVTGDQGARTNRAGAVLGCS
ncbi:hypothetical protein BDZ45DRAFT_734814 [Acephala macrosclerotiorum]|nr:hypothetical protein BDZ45DRAFT_734814 [Acephala macrosclerotiorum]